MAVFNSPPYNGTPDPDQMFGTANGEDFFGNGGDDVILAGWQR